MDTPSQKVEKRNRPPVSCEPCRTRKLKCNRQVPCDTCVRRKLQSSCQYAANAERNKPKVSSQARLNDRLKSIEEMVYSLISTGTTPQLASRYRGGGDVTDPSPSDLGNPPGPSVNDQFSHLRMKSVPGRETPRFIHNQNGETIYTEPSHWMSILQDIKDMRADLSSNNSLAFHELASSQDLRLEPDISLGIAQKDISTVSDVLTSLPAQPTCDMLLSQYFNSRYMVLGIVHYGKFRMEYENFWKHPQNASLGWLALLFAILGMSTILHSKTKASTALNQQPMVSTQAFQQMTAQCLVLGGYATAKEYVLEALLLYIQSRFIMQTSCNAQLWLELGTLVRLAFRMAYHRDSSQLTDMSEFEGEMRRRVWLHIFQIDALASFHMGLPSMIPTEYCDSQVPRNLYDTDLDVGMESLPPSRPYTERTPILYGVVKSGVMSVFKKIVAHTQSLVSPGYDETLALDREMKETYRRTPDVLRRRDVCQSFMDSSDIILERCTIELLFLKGIVVLHRRYIRHEPQNPTFELSRRFCLEAALEILARQADIHQATLPGGRLHEDRWMVTSLTVQDFLLAAMVVCLDLSVRMETLQDDDDQSFPSKKLRALQVSQQIWRENGSYPPQSRLASLALEWMIQKVNKVNVNLPTESLHVPDTDMHSFSGTELPYFEVMSDMIDGTEALDWSLIDQFLQSPGANPP